MGRKWECDIDVTWEKNGTWWHRSELARVDACRTPKQESTMTVEVDDLTWRVFVVLHVRRALKIRVITILLASAMFSLDTGKKESKLDVVYPEKNHHRCRS